MRMKKKIEKKTKQKKCLQTLMKYKKKIYLSFNLTTDCKCKI